MNNGGSLPPGWQKNSIAATPSPNDLWGLHLTAELLAGPALSGNPGNGIDYYSIGNRLLKLNRRSDSRILDVMDF